MSRLTAWGVKPFGYFDEMGEVVWIEQHVHDPQFNQQRVVEALDRAERCGFQILYISAAPDGCDAQERHTHTGHHFECSKGCKSLRYCTRRIGV